MSDRYSCILYDSMKTTVEDAWKIIKKLLWQHCTHPKMPFCFLLFSTLFREKCNDIDVNKNQDKMLIPGQPSIVVWHHINNLHLILRIFKKKTCSNSTWIPWFKHGFSCLKTTCRGFDNGFKWLQTAMCIDIYAKMLFNIPVSNHGQVT